VGDIHLGGKGFDAPLQILFGQVSDHAATKRIGKRIVVLTAAVDERPDGGRVHLLD
jgi:hypothetical protein